MIDVLSNLPYLIFLLPVMIIPFSLVAAGLSFLIGKIPPTNFRFVVAPALAVIFTVLNQSMMPPVGDTPWILLAVTGILINPLWIVTPYPFFTRYFRHSHPQLIMFTASAVTIFLGIVVGLFGGDAVVFPDSLVSRLMTQVQVILWDVGCTSAVLAAFAAYFIHRSRGLESSPREHQG